MYMHMNVHVYTDRSLFNFYEYGYFVCVYLYRICRASAYGGQKRALDPLEPESWTVVNRHMHVGS